MKLPEKILFALSLMPLMWSCWDDNGEPNHHETEHFLPGQGIVEYTGYAPLSGKPVRVHYYIPPQGDAKTMPALMVFPGVNRNADEYLTAWIDAARTKQFMVFSLEFPQDSYSSAQYIEGGMYSGETLLPVVEWTFSMIEPLFDFMRRDLGGSQTQYDIWGHSAGAQFVHRYMTFVPENRVRRAVAANAGWYTVPDFSVGYPYGLKNSPAQQAAMPELFAKQFTLHLGTADNDTNDPSLNHSAGADAQGKNRYARGQNYWNKAQTAAGGNTFRWEKREETGVAHEYAKMAAAAAKFMY